jgi:peptide deformylase
MALLPILEFPDPRLRTRAEPVQQFDAALRQLVADMLQTMYAAPGIGLAATQVDVHRRLLVMDVSAGHDQPQIYINPEIVTRDGVEVSEEGCLSVPNIFEQVERVARIQVRAQDEHGAPFERELTGLAAVCLQHEIDHLAGKLFVDYLSALKRERIRRKLEKERRERASGAAKPAARATCCASSLPARRSLRCRHCRHWRSHAMPWSEF